MRSTVIKMDQERCSEKDFLGEEPEATNELIKHLGLKKYEAKRLQRALTGSCDKGEGGENGGIGGG